MNNLPVSPINFNIRPYISNTNIPNYYNSINVVNEYSIPNYTKKGTKRKYKIIFNPNKRAKN